MSPSPRHRGHAGFLASVLLLACTAAAAASPAASSAAKEQPGLTVTTATVQRADWPQVLAASGAVQPWHEAVLSARSSGLALTEMLVDRGSRVQRGQVLARFDDRSLRTDLAQAEASLQQAEAQARQAVTNRDRTLSLRHSGAVSEQDELQAVTTAATAVAQWRQAQAALAAARVRLDQAVLTAPDSGTISSRSATLGQVAANGMDVFRLIRQDRLEWRAEVPPAQLAALQVGQAAELVLPDGRKATGKLRVLSPSLDAATRLALVSVDIAPGSGARAGMYVQGRLFTGRAVALVVPADSLVLRDGRPYAFVLHGPRVRRVAVTTGRREGASVEVLQGLAAGDRVVVRGAGFLADGDPVQLAPAAAAVGLIRRPQT
jgi:RND family efflux transporter MFP subunit